ncbi:hypothetical protein [Dactylosporangium sp. NPDC048998]|uniref:hypothetical protein n=1 Tax=Dactylosporangium sp. NPDC048998 TaxID=3363976 RepID=UPI003716C1BA
MLSATLVGTARHPRLTLGGAVAVAASLVGLQLLAPSDSNTRYAIPAVLSLLGLASAGMALVALTRPRPAAFVVDADAPAFRALPHPGHVYSAATAVFMTATEATFRVILPDADRDTAFDDPGWRVMTGTFGLLTIVLGVLTVPLIAAVWRDVGVQLRPSGLVDRSALGTVTVPWDALSASSLPPTTPSATSVRLTYARPELVRVRGLPFSRRRIRTDGVNALFLVHAINHYLMHPQRRQAIGTEAEYGDLLSALHGARLP